LRCHGSHTGIHRRSHRARNEKPGKCRAGAGGKPSPECCGEQAMSIVCRLIGLFALLGISAGTAAAKANRVLKLPGNTTELVRWSPVPPHYLYQDLLPHAERMS